MAYWLFKEEPDHYSLEQLFRDKRTVWDGVENNLALKHLRSVKKGDRVLYYHTGTEKAVVGVMEVVKGPYRDPKRDDSEYGKFAWIYDPDGNKIELWEPPASEQA